MNAKTEKKAPALFILCLLGVITYISLIWNNNLWVDEAFTACIVRSSFPEMLRSTLSDTLPPFYNIFAWTVTSLLGFNSITLKLCSVIPMAILLLWIIPFKMKDLFGYAASFFYAICVISLPHFLHYGVEIRMYSWALFAAGCAGIFMYASLTSASKSSLVLFSFFTILSAATHYYALLCCFFLWIAAFILCIPPVRKKFKEIRLALKPLILTAAVTLVIYLPFLYLTFFQLSKANSHFSMEKVTLGAFLSDVRFPFVTNFTPLSLLLLIVAVFVTGSVIWFIRKNRGDLKPLICLLYICILYIILIISYIMAIIRGNNFFTSRYLVPALGLFWLGISVALSMLYETDVRFASLAILPLIALFVIYPQEFKSEYAPGVNAMTSYFDSQLKEGDGYIIYDDKYQIELCMRYYYPSFKKYSWDNIDEISGNAYYMLVPGYEEYLDEAAEHGYSAEFITNMSFDRYNFGLYRLNRP